MKDVIYDKVNNNALKITRIYKNQKIPEQGPFVDDLFPPNNNSIFAKTKDGNYTDPIETRRAGYLKDFYVKEDEIVWLRAHEIFDGGKFAIFEGSIDVDDIKQGSIGDCYFLSAIAALSEFPQLIAQIFRTLKTPVNGCYEIVMRINGIWKVILLDDYFPCYKSNKQLIFCKPKGAEIWTMLLEKAWAKINKGYLNIVGGWATEVLGTLTPFPLEYCLHKSSDTEEKKNTLWQKIRDYDQNGYIMAANTKFSNSLEAYGLVAGHAFTLISVKEGIVDGKLVRLCKIRNPWGYREWAGDWSDNSNKWTNEAIQVFNFKKNAEEDGIFWIAYEDFLRFFDETEVCKVSSPVASISIQIPKQRVERSNIFELIITKKTLVNISVIKKNYRFNRSIGPTDEVMVNLIVAKKVGEQLIYAGSTSEGKPNPNLSLELETGNYIIYINANYTTGKYDKKRKHVLFVSCDNYFDLVDRGNDDDDFSILKEIIIRQIKECKIEELKEDYTQVCSAAFEKTSLGYLYIWNKTEFGYSVEGKEEMQHMFLLTKFSGSVTIPTGNDWIAIGNRTTYYPGKYMFFINYSNNPTDSTDNSSCVRNKKILTEILGNHNSSGISEYDFIYNRIPADLSKVIEVIDPISTAIDCLKLNYQNQMNELLALKPLEDGIKVIFKDKYDFGDSYYLGEWQFNNGRVKHGRGTYVWNNGTYFVGYYVNNQMEGLGKYTFENGDIYQFNFKQGNMDGVGTIKYFVGGETVKAEYSDGNFIKNL